MAEELVTLSDIGASESIMKKKTKQDFQELLKTEHGKNETLTLHIRCDICWCYWCKSWFICSSFTWRIWNAWIHFFHRGAHQQTGACVSTASVRTGAAIIITCWKFIHSFPFFKVSMIESLRMLCLLSITENGELTSYNWLIIKVLNAVLPTMWLSFLHRTPAKRLPLIKSSISTGETQHAPEDF